jgi:hypothetical protein
MTATTAAGSKYFGTNSSKKLYQGRDKTFFFFDYEGNRKTQSYPGQRLCQPRPSGTAI